MGHKDDLENLVTLSERVGHTAFVGYTQNEVEANILGLVVEGRLQEQASTGVEVEIVLDRTPFYAESGGQVGDTGTIRGPRGLIDVLDTQRPYGGIVVHKGRVTEGQITVGEHITAAIDSVRRAAIRPHHSGTHLLHLALHEILGPEATQAGSLVAPDRLRFDFRWPRQVTPKELKRIQERMNELVFEDDPVFTRELSYAEAVEEGAMALFGEKYGDMVRVVSMGPSKELCGGTHVAETIDIGPMVIISESGIGAGIRRIEALAGRAAYEHFRHSEEAVATVAETLGTTPERLGQRAQEVVEQLKASERRITQLSRQLTTRRALEVASLAEHLNGDGNPWLLVVQKVDADSPDDLHQLALATVKTMGSGIVVMGAVIGDKPQFAAAVSADMESRGYNARQIAQKVGQAVAGGAGGSAAFAQGGGRNREGLDNGLREAEAFVRGSVASDA